MGVRFPSVFSTTFIGPLPASAVETIVLTTPLISEPVDNAAVTLVCFANIVTGTGTTALVGRLRRGTTVAGQVVTTNPITITAGAAVGAEVVIVYQDNPGVVAGQQYTLTIAQTGATAAGVWQDGGLFAMVL